MTYGSNGWDSRLAGGSEIIRAVAGEKQNQLLTEGISVFRNYNRTFLIFMAAAKSSKEKGYEE